jgi:outer membrane protein OmpA-like peptidoglycan-associated protein
MKVYTTTTLARCARFIGAGLVTLFCLLSFSTAKAQSRAGNIYFGFDGGSNKYYGNFTGSQFGFDGDLFIKWNIVDWLSLHGAYNGGQLRYAVDANALNANPQYFGNNVVTGTSKYPGTNITIDPANVVRTGGWELMLSANVFPSQTFVPYFIAGLEELNFEPKTANNGQSLPNNALAVYSKNVLGGVMGVGYDMYITNKVTFNGKILLHLTGTDYLDDYSDPNNSRQDAFLTFGMGFAYVIFAPPEEIVTPTMHTDVERNTYNNNTYNTTINHRDTTMVNLHDTTTVNLHDTTTLVRSDTVYMQNPTDTVYLRNPKVNAIYNYPGTLFIVNTDQFNMAENGNAENLNMIKELVEQCPGMRIEVQGFASNEGTPARNQELSEQRALRIKTWLVAQGVNPDKIVNTVGFGTSRPLVTEPVGGSAEKLEDARIQNRRIAIRVVATCAL